ncbi:MULTISPECIES: hypothetical protein [Maricaulis]|uniref:hypothetical protein n=1 Tax=Maricaulis TaxID=74317 RepID=UPI001232857A|nr:MULTISPECIES: hypothetical protein [Maricaulis]
MTPNFPDCDLDLIPTEIDDNTLAAIGRLVIGFADIEDAITLFIMKLMKLNESHAHVLIGPVGISKRIQIATSLALLTDPEAHKFLKSTFQGNNWNTAKKMRDCAAHGLVVGQNKPGFVTFRMTNLVDSDENQAMFSAHSYPMKQFSTVAADVSNFVPSLREHLGVATLHSKRLQGSLVPRQKGRRKASPDPRSPKPPRSSPA